MKKETNKLSDDQVKKLKSDKKKDVERGKIVKK